MDKLIFKFELNGNEYSVYTTDLIEGDDATMGLTIFTDDKVYIKNMRNKNQMTRSLIHELAHVWLYEYGHNQHDENKTFNNEDVCEIIACSHDWINLITNEYTRAINKLQEEENG